VVAKYFRDGDLYDATESELDAANALYTESGTSKTDVSRLLRRLDDDQQAAFLSDDLDTSTRTDLYDAWERSEDVTASDVGDAADTYKSLDSSDQTTYEGLLDRQGEGATVVLPAASAGIASPNVPSSKEATTSARIFPDIY